MNSIERAEWNSFASLYVKEIEQFARKEIYPDFKLSSVKFDWSPKRRSSRGGMYSDGPGINMAMNHLCKDNCGEIYRVYEYKSFDSDPNIGGFYTRDKYARLKMVIVHEIAHALQYNCYKINRFRCTPHGPTWKNLYKRLRMQFINPTLEDQETLRSDYESFKNSLQGIKRDPLSIYERAASK